MPVLITAGLSPEAHRIRRILNVKDVVFSDMTELPSIPGTQSLILPSASSPSFTHEALKACLDLSISYLYPLKWNEIIELSKARALFQEYNVALIIPTDEMLNRPLAKSCGRDEHISILENGIMIAGDEYPTEFPLKKESGIFTWATSGQKTEYSLYVVGDAGI